MPKLWNETIEAHRRAMREATLDTTLAARTVSPSAPVEEVLRQSGNAEDEEDGDE